MLFLIARKGVSKADEVMVHKTFGARGTFVYEFGPGGISAQNKGKTYLSQLLLKPKGLPAPMIQ